MGYLIPVQKFPTSGCNLNKKIKSLQKGHQGLSNWVAGLKDSETSEEERGQGGTLDKEGIPWGKGNPEC